VALAEDGASAVFSLLFSFFLSRGTSLPRSPFFFRSSKHPELAFALPGSPSSLRVP